MTQPAKAQEPTMEEILASIRRIIADDDSGKAAPKPDDPVPPPPASLAPRPEPIASTPAAPVPPVRPSAEPAMRQAEIDAMLSNASVPPPPPPVSSAPPTQAPTPAPAPVEEASADVLELTESMATPAEEPVAHGGFRTIDGNFDVMFDERPLEPEPVPPLREIRTAAAPVEALMSAATTAAVDSAFNTLAHTVLVQNGRTLEDLVREMLRPMLKTWLDDNLPGLVERLVRAEIERVSRGRTG